MPSAENVSDVVSEEFEEFDVYHRHVSHLYGFYPADVITTENNPEVANMVRRSLERRGDEGTGWSMGWKVCLWAKLKDGDHAMKLVKNQLRFMPARPDNKVDMWHSGGTYSVYSAESSAFACAIASLSSVRSPA